MQRNFLILVFFIFTISHAQNYKEQKDIIAVLSGDKATPDGILITDRSSAENRKYTREYLSLLIADLGLISKIQEYKMPNLNPLIDLLFNPFDGANVYTVLPSTTESDNYVILGAHFDSERFCPGAIDNASGMALIYSVLKKIQSLEKRNMNIMVVFFDQEEEDLIGSQAFAKYCKKEGFNIHSVHTIDTIGWDRDDDKAIELELPSESLKELYAKHANRLGIPFHVTGVNSTDHHSFRELGFNAIGLTDEYVNGDYAPYKDTEKDVFNTVNFSYLSSCTTLVYETIKDIVMQ